MTDLTKQWKNGELEGEYYIETTNGEIYIVEIQNSISVKRKNLPKVKSFKGYVYKKTVKEVLTPVPSYQELKASYNCMAENEVLRLKNAQLKELLKECQHMILAYSINHDTFTKEKVLDTVKQIDNAIGEKK